MINKEPYQSSEVPDSERTGLGTEATANPEASQTEHADNLAIGDSPSIPVVAPAKKRARKVRSRPISGVLEQRARKRSQAANVHAELEREPELLTGLESEPSPTEPVQSAEAAPASPSNGSLSAVAEAGWSPQDILAEHQIVAPQVGDDSRESPPADVSPVDSHPCTWAANGSEIVDLNVPPVAETGAALSAADFHDTQAEEQSVNSAPALAHEHHTDEAFEHRWQYNEYARQPEPQAFVAGAAAGASIVGHESPAEPDPRIDTRVISRGSSKSLGSRIRLQVALIALMPILLGGLITGVIAFLSPDVFAARSEIVLNISSLDWSAAERFRATQLVVVKARSTLVPISESMNVPVRDLERNIEVGMVGASDVISIQYANRDPATALAVVNAVTAQYLIDLRDFEQIRNGRHRVLLPATLLDDPVSLSPLRAAMIGGIVGFVIAMAGVVLRTQIWPIK